MFQEGSMPLNFVKEKKHILMPVFPPSFPLKVTQIGIHQRSQKGQVKD